MRTWAASMCERSEPAWEGIRGGDDETKAGEMAEEVLLSDLLARRARPALVREPQCLNVAGHKAKLARTGWAQEPRG